MRRRLIAAALLGSLAAAASVAAAAPVAAPGRSAAARGSKVIDIYSSLPLQGPSSAQTIPMVNGIKVAWEQAHGRAGRFRVNYTSLDDSTAAAGQWDPSQAAADARRVASDPRAVYYIGEFNSGASEVSIPILNQAGIAQVSPDNTYVGLTTHDPGSAPGEPGKYYPTGERTYLRLSARDTIQAQALLATMHRDGCGTVAIANDIEAYGAGLATLVRRQAGRYHVHVVSDRGYNPRARGYGALAARIRGEHPNCFMLSGIVANNGVAVMRAVAHAIPHARLYGGDGLCTVSMTERRNGGVGRAIARRFECTNLTMPLGAYPGGKQFLAAYKPRFGSALPDSYAIYGYEAMKLGLDTIAQLGAAGDSRQAIIHALFATRHRQSVLGTYSFDRNGDTTLRSYGVYRAAGPGGSLRFVRDAF
jgi:branched-chain amino acid transport system substrate-binding protein